MGLNIAVALTILVISIPTAGTIIARGLSADWQTDAFLDVPATQHPLLAVVAVDKCALEGYSSSPPDRHVLAQLVHRIDDLGAAAVGLDYFFVGPTEPEKDAELIDALRSAKSQIVVGAADERAGLIRGDTNSNVSSLRRSVGQPVILPRYRRRPCGPSASISHQRRNLS